MGTNYPPPSSAADNRSALKTRVLSFFLAVAFLVFFGVIAAVIVQSKPEPPQTEVRESIFVVRTATAQITTARPSVLLIGEVEARDYAALAAPVEAEVLAIAAREGERVAKNTRLLRLDLREQQFSAQSQQAAVENVRLQLSALQRNRTADRQRLNETKHLLNLAARDYARNITLQAENLVPQAQIESAEQAVGQRRLEFVALQNQVDNYDTEERRLQQSLIQGQAALAQARLLIERGEMRAPFNGQVTKVHTSVGARPVRGAPLLEIFNPDSVRLRASVPNRYALTLLGGQESRAQLFVGGETVELPISNVAPRAEAGQGSVEAFFDLPPGNWVLGTTFEFYLQLPPLAGTLELPFDAVYAESRVYRIVQEGGDSRAQGVTCERLGVSRQNGGISALLRCPKVREGDSIVITQTSGMSEGAKLRVLAPASP